MRSRATSLDLRERAVAGGLVLGALLGLTFVASTRAVAVPQIDPSRVVLDATHLPPLLTVAGEEIALRYDAGCARTDSQVDDAACRTAGTVFVRAGVTGSFQAIALRLDRNALEGRLVAHVPPAIARSGHGFSYYAVLTADADGDGGRDASMTLPAGGAAAPHRSLPLGRAVAVSLGRHQFGRHRTPEARVAAAPWGDGVGEVGLEGGVNAPPIGGSSFDVDAAGSVFLLDQVHRRVLRWMAGASRPSAIPVAVDGTIADLAVAGTGAMYVLEGGRSERGPTLRTFDRAGTTISVAELGERTATQVKVGPAGALVLQHPSGQWTPVARGGSSLPAPAQATAGLSGRLLSNGEEMVVLRTGNEVRVAVTDGERVRRSWRIASATPLAEVQLAEPFADGVLVVVRVHSETDDEFVALVLGSRGLVARAALDSADWAESAPLGRFRLAGSALYQLRSTQAGVFVDRFDLEATQ